jgi:hypothetical protein
MASSKTARKSNPTAANGKFQPDASASRIIPLNSGQNAYVFDDTGKLHHHRTDSAEFIAALCAYAQNLGVERVLRDIRNANQPAWADLGARVESALAPAAEEA